MRMKRGSVATLLLVTLIAGCRATPSSVDPDEIIAMERAALDRWGRGDPQGYLEIMAPAVTYFDPNEEARIDGLDAMKALLVPLTGQIKIDRYDMIHPVVQIHGSVALLTFNLVSYVSSNGVETAAARWNSTEAYASVGGRWQIIHSHWSYIKPELATPVPSGV